MKLQLTIIALECLHFDDGCFLQIVEAELLALEFWHVLDNSSESIYQVNNIVAFVENNIDVLASGRKLGAQTPSDHILHQLWVRLITNFKHIIFVDGSKSSSSSLQIVESIPHVTFCSENNCLISLIFAIKRL